MDVEEKFIQVSNLLCEPTRAKMLWNLLDGRAYTASELAVVADISATSASNHLSKLLEADLVKVENQGRHRYYSFSRTEVAYAVEALANLAGKVDRPIDGKVVSKNGVKYCRTCYDHLAGYVGVRVTTALEEKGYLIADNSGYTLTDIGWEWATGIGISKEEITSRRRLSARQCLDWSERRPHLAGEFAAALLSKMLKEKWFMKVQFSRELIITSIGQRKLSELLELNF